MKTKKKVCHCLPSGLSSISSLFKTPVRTSTLFPTCHMICHPIPINVFTRIISGEEQSSPITCYPLLRPNTLLNTPFSRTLNPRSSFNVRDHVSHPHKNRGKITDLCILAFIFMDNVSKEK